MIALSWSITVFGEPDPHPAKVTHHGSNKLKKEPHEPVTPYPPAYGHTTPVYGHPPPYGHSTPAYGHPSPAYGYPDHAHDSHTPKYGHASPSYGHVPPSYGHPSPTYSHLPESFVQHSPTYGYSTPPSPLYGEHHPKQEYGKYPPSYPAHQPTYKTPKYCKYDKAPKCSLNTTKPWCLDDYLYPEYEIQAAVEQHKKDLLSLYADVADLNTANSVVRPTTLEEETYLCPSKTDYVRPLRAINTEGKWRIILNNVKVGYEALSQTTRIEECSTPAKPCPLVPYCMDSSCLQKSVYQRFLIFDPCDKYFPFAIESFKLPASCACHLGSYYVTH